MNPIETALTWLWLMQVRFLRRPAFLVLLALTPLLVLSLRLAAGDGGLVRVALCPGADSLSRSVTADLLAEEGLLSFSLYTDPAAAREAAASGQADAAWIFAPDTEGELRRYVTGEARRYGTGGQYGTGSQYGTGGQYGTGSQYGTGRRYGTGYEAEQPAAVTVVEREDSVFLMLAREKLYAALFPAVSWQAYRHTLTESMEQRPVPADQAVSPDTVSADTAPADTAPADTAPADTVPAEAVPAEEAVLLAYFRRVEMDRDIVTFSNLDGEAAETGPGMLLSPVRGLLSVFLMLGGMAAGLFLLGDRGAFAWVRPRNRPLLAAGLFLLPVGDLALAVLAALTAAGLSTGLAREAALLALLTAAGAGFCRLVCRLLRTPEQISGAALVLTLGMLALCPVFVDVGPFRPLGRLFPPFYYLGAVHDGAYLGQLALYALAVWVLNGLLDRAGGLG